MDSELLVVEGLEVSYSGNRAVRGVDLRVNPGAIVAVVGPNGAGKTSLLRGITGLEPSRGSVRLAGRTLSQARPWRVARSGISQVPQGRRLYPDMTVAENLALGEYVRRGPSAWAEVLELFPILRDRASQPAGLLSGGEQQMVAIGRALMARPRIVLLDEPSFGLAPLVIRSVFGVISKIVEMGVSVLLVEQNATQALAISDYAYVLNRGTVVYEGDARAVREQQSILEAYLA